MERPELWNEIEQGKINNKEKQDEEDQDKFFSENVMSKLKNKSFLVLLDHEYSQDCSPSLLTGVDRSIYSALTYYNQNNNNPYTFRIVSIRVDYSQDEENSESFTIYPLSDTILKGDEDPNPFNLKSRQIIVLNPPRFQKGVMWDERESRSGDENSIYIHKAILANPIANNNNNKSNRIEDAELSQRQKKQRLDYYFDSFLSSFFAPESDSETKNLQ